MTPPWYTEQSGGVDNHLRVYVCTDRTGVLLDVRRHQNSGISVEYYIHSLTPLSRQWERTMVPHGGYTVPNSPTRYAHPAPSLDIRCRVTNAVPTAEHASDSLCACARPCSRCLSNGNVPWYHTVDIQSLIHRPGTLTRPRHTIFVRRAAPFLPCKIANLVGLRNYVRKVVTRTCHHTHS